MITDEQVAKVFANTVTVNMTQIRAVLEVYDNLFQQVKPEVQYFLKDAYNGDEDTFDTKEEVIHHISMKIKDRGWDEDDVENYMQVIEGKDLDIIVKKTVTVEIS